jgi:hypothetical protein
MGGQARRRQASGQPSRQSCAALEFVPLVVVDEVGYRWPGSGWPICSMSTATSCTAPTPLRTKAIASARVKTVAVDARTLAHLLRADLLPQAYLAPRELRDQRDLLRQRVVLTQMRSALKNRVSTA